MVTDLSEYSRPFTDFLKMPSTAAERAAYRLTDEQVRFYHENGYLAGIRILNAIALSN